MLLVTRDGCSGIWRATEKRQLAYVQLPNAPYLLVEFVDGPPSGAAEIHNRAQHFPPHPASFNLVGRYPLVRVVGRAHDLGVRTEAIDEELGLSIVISGD